MRILFIDLATVSGYALGTVAGLEESGVITLPRTGTDFGSFLKAILEGFADLLDRTRPDQVGYEQPILAAMGKTNLQTLRKLYLIGPGLELSALERHIPCFEGNLGDIRTHFLGRGNVPGNSKAAKIAVKNQCRRRGWKFQDDNEADALAGLDWALACDTPTFAVAGTPLFGKAVAL